ncbi:hypothetical protein [Cellulomonas cellasea]|uniref:Uncharacterized protein n=2 Tax=Cellulomonas cellasea TaxID=43670 RepID=A0A0A0B7L2_9CELL|nr:hypothetical protein [Cellulomonas cellasea]KGM02208.1 hypothetical protein Q760_14920 [Cellulomonas cellasea DSM 20118]GEA86163.1 hypothetical protein CCE01nite_01120 [Cellulomonas cellasea]
MRTHTLTTAAAAVGCTVLLLVGGCSSDKEPKDAAAVSEDDKGPLSAYLEGVMGSMEDQDWSEMGRRSEEIVAACMREQGFEYTQQDMSAVTETIEEDQKDADRYGTEEYAAEHGYGMSTSYDAPAAGEEEWVDPNAEYVAAMSEEERAAYQAALFGDQAAAAQGAAPSGDWTTQGCQGKAQHEVYEQGQAWADPEFATLQEEMTALYERATSDPKMTEANAAWSACMAEAGYADLATPEDAVEAVSQEFSAIVSATTAEAPEPDPAAVAAFTEKEIATAVADARCKASTEYEEKAREVQFALEQEFVDQHEAELDAWAEKYSTADGS